MSRLEVHGLGKSFGAARALDDVTLAVGPGEIVGITGPSGAGKSTICRVVAGIETADTGEVVMDGTPVTAVPPERRRVAFMFESYALYPQLTVFENVAFPLRAPGARPLPRAELTARVRDVLALVELDGLEGRRPGELSGGQKQRVALCRALVQESRACLLDEPISHLDAKLRHVLRGALRRRLVRTDAAIVWTSPDAAETLAVADRVAVLVAGRVQQLAPPAEVYRRPATVDVARLVGDPPMNLVEGALAEEAGALRFRHAAFGVSLPSALRTRLARDARRDRVVLGLRPADIRLAEGTESARGEVWVWEPLGKHGILSVRVGADVVKVKVAKDRSWERGAAVALDMSATEPVLFDAITGGVL